MTNFINVFGSKTGNEEITNVTDSLAKQWLGMGPKVAQFETNFKSHRNLNHFFMLDSGSNALYMAVTLLNLPPKSEIIVPTFTWVSCAQAVLLAGHTPIFADVNLATMNITADTIKPHLSKKTGAIMVVHYAGLPVDMVPIQKLGYPIIEDAAHATTASHKGTTCGSIADIGIFSFDAVKNLAVGEGGGITMHNAKMAERAKKLRYCGIEKSGFEASTHGKQRWWEYTITEPFIKMNPSDIAGAIGIEQLKKLDTLQERRQEIWDIYQTEFANIDWLKTPADAPAADVHGLFTYAIRTTKGNNSKSRDNLAHHLFSKNIYTTLRYHPLHLNDLYNQTNVNLPNAQTLNEDCLSIPLHPNLSDDDLTKIITEIKNFS